MKEKLMKLNKLDIGISIYGVLYLLSFLWLELNDSNAAVVHSPIDDVIPFCEYFIIPYMLWFVFVFGTKVYLGNEKRNRENYYRLLATMCTGMTLFLIVSFVFPNGHNLRPELSGNGVFVKAVQILYMIDTPTNILPSLHVFEAVACCVALLSDDEFAKRKYWCVGTVVLTISIIMATMFLKQHSVIDVISGFILYCICYELFYKFMPSKKEMWSKYVTEKEIFTIPNVLSMIRILLAVLFLGIFNRYGMEEKQGLLMGILIVSGITDFLDGKIARKYNMISEFGKLIDPVADKLTQGVVLWCFIERYPLAKIVFILFIIKEGFMLIAGTKTVEETGKNDGAKWYGKVSTAVFYTVMIILVLFRNIPVKIANTLLLISGFCMLMALLLYARQYRAERNLARSRKGECL